MVELYPWQKEAINSYNGKGTIKAVTAAGKSLVGRKVAEKVGGNTLVCSHRTTILDQWRKIMKGIPNVQFGTFQALCKKQINNIDLLIVDECHRSTSQEFIKIYDNIKYKNILGLSATPNIESIDKCGPLISNIGFDEANVAPFKVIFQGIELNPYERNKYRQLSYSIAKLVGIENPTDEEKKLLTILIMRRRDIVYRAQTRIAFAINLIIKHWTKGNKILVMCQRIDQVQELSKKLVAIPHIQYHSANKGDLELYKSGKVNLCLSVGMLREGFDDPSTDIGIIVSTSITESFNIQSVGRIIRFKPDKEAKIYILVANNTSDTKILEIAEAAGYDYIDKNVIRPEKSEFLKEYYHKESRRYGFSMGEVWQKTKDGRQYMEHHDIINKLKQIKPGGGSFIVAPSGVYTKVKNKIIKVSDEQVIFTPVKEKRTIDVEELFGKF